MSRWYLVEADDDLAAHRITERALPMLLEHVPAVIGVVDLGEDCEVVDTLRELTHAGVRVVVWPS
jgi:hypothetical protein